MASHLDILTQAISDMGYWRWWTHSLPQSIQLEFGWVQLWNPPLEEGKPPSNIIALRFIEPVSASFLTHREAEKDLPIDWPELLRNDQLEPFSITYESFGFNNPQLLTEILSEAKKVEGLYGAAADASQLSEAKLTLAFWAGSVGMIIAAQGLMVLSHQGEIQPDQVERKHQQWWEYWQEYWRLRDTKNPLPRDNACEVTIPAG
ncbi:MAG: hypothetical protein M3441_03015 [Chloroflexota bacterium]|nr:hypothetical protein [Chloroflexota bacterium]